jgi:hypothetical protein
VTGFYGNPHREIEEVGRRLRKSHVVSVRARLKLQERVERLEDELEWTRLVASTLLGVCVEKGLVTAEELEARMKAADVSDGADEGTSAAVPLAPPPPAKPVRRKRFKPRV